MVKSLVHAPPEVRWSASVRRAGSSAIRDLLAVAEQPGVVSLAGGLPNPATFPVDAIERATRTVLADDPIGALQYGGSEGFEPLRHWIADRHGGAYAGLDEQHVLVTSGSQQALDLVTRSLLSPGDAIALGDPAYVGALQSFRANDATLAAIATDHDGLRVDHLAERLAGGLRPTMVYVVSNFDNPSGATLSASRRIDLAALADRYGFWIVDDDPYGELRWRGSVPTPLRELNDRVITLGTTSKVLCPGLRVGWAVGPAKAIRGATILKQAADIHTSTFSQRIVHQILAEPGFLVGQVELLRTAYRRQADHLHRALVDRLDDRLTVEPVDGGMFLWAELADHRSDTARLLPIAVDHGVAFVPGVAFAVDDLHPKRMRLSFATATTDDLTRAVDRLAEVIAEA